MRVQAAVSSFAVAKRQKLPFHPAPGLSSGAATALKALPTCIKTVVLIGIGGSALGACFVHAAFSPGRRLMVLDTLSPQSLAAVKACKPKETVCVTVSKSGTTLETLQQLQHLRSWYARLPACQRLVLTAEPKSPLGLYAQKKGDTLLLLNTDIGGRFSVFTDAQLVPLAASGVSVSVVMGAARAAASRTVSVLTYLLLAANRRSLSVVVDSPTLLPFAQWCVQLISESLGKKKNGPFITVGLLPRDRHSLLQFWLDGPRPQNFLCVTSPVSRTAIGGLVHTECAVTISQLKEKGHAVVHAQLETLPDVCTLAQSLLCAVPAAASNLGIPHSGQPAVEASKKKLYDALS